MKHLSLTASARTDSALLGAEPLPVQLALDTQPYLFVTLIKFFQVWLLYTYQYTKSPHIPVK